MSKPTSIFFETPSWAHVQLIQNRLDRTDAILGLMGAEPPQQSYAKEVNAYTGSIAYEWTELKRVLDEKRYQLPEYFTGLAEHVGYIVDVSYQAMHLLAGQPATKTRHHLTNIITISLPGFWAPECTALDIFENPSNSNAYNHPPVLSDTFGIFAHGLDPENDLVGTLEESISFSQDDTSVRLCREIRTMLLLKNKIRDGLVVCSQPNEYSFTPEDLLNNICLGHIGMAYIASEAAVTMAEAIMLDDGLNNPDDISRFADAELPWLIRIGETALKAAKDIQGYGAAYLVERPVKQIPRLFQTPPEPRP